MDLQIKLSEIQENFRESHISSQFQVTQYNFKVKLNSRSGTPNKTAGIVKDNSNIEKNFNIDDAEKTKTKISNYQEETKLAEKFESKKQVSSNLQLPISGGNFTTNFINEGEKYKNEIGISKEEEDFIDNPVRLNNTKYT